MEAKPILEDFESLGLLSQKLFRSLRQDNSRVLLDVIASPF
jgi:hypothetical protein